MQNSFVRDFYSNFINLKNIPMVLYGIGQYTKEILDNISDFHFVGLMDRNTTGQVIYGKKVLSEHEVVSQAKAIIIVSNLSIAPKIYERIKNLAVENGIEVYYLNGLQPKQYDNKISQIPYWNKSEEDLKRKIRECDVISFDVFDTLLMRTVENPEDVFDLVWLEKKHDGLEQSYIHKRKEAEKICYRTVSKFFTLEQIYDELAKNNSYLTHKEWESIAELEIEIEKRCIVVRSKMLELFNWAKTEGKTIILTTDMYLGKSIIANLLEQNGIIGYKELYISCEIKCDKYWGDIWEFIKSEYPDKKILHIGDNEISDKKTANEHGIETYRIEKANILMQMSGIADFMKCSNKIEDRLLKGVFASKALNNPFGINKTKGKLVVNSMFEFGYLFFGPLVLNYLLWLIREVKEKRIDSILFVSRDGYLLEKLYNKLIENQGDESVKGLYFLSSRRAASVAAIESKEDIWFVIDKMCNTTDIKYAHMLRNAFGIELEKDDELSDRTIYQIGKKEAFIHTWEKYGTKILEHAKLEREGYINYISKLHLGENIGFVNFVCRGVTQYCISRLLNKKIKGFYFASEQEIQEIYPDMDDIFCLYGENESTHTSKLNLIINFLFGEAVFTAPDSQLVCFSKEGNPIFHDKKNDNYIHMKDCHRGIEKYVSEMCSLVPNIFNISFSNILVDQIFGLFSSQYVLLADDVKKALCVDDYYSEEERKLF